MDLKTYCPEKVVNAEQATAKIKNGRRLGTVQDLLP